MDRMTSAEAENLIKCGYMREMDAWERMREMMTLYANSVSKKTIEKADVFKFPWDEAEDDDDDDGYMPTEDELRAVLSSHKPIDTDKVKDEF